ncbi:hypothetical protein ACVIM9_008269 [Bradyrhizobium sp. USDA 4520]
MAVVLVSRVRAAKNLRVSFADLSSVYERIRRVGARGDRTRVCGREEVGMAAGVMERTRQALGVLSLLVSLVGTRHRLEMGRLVASTS